MADTQRMAVHGWRSRGYLPHCDEDGLVQHIVFGLNDAISSAPPASIERVGDRAAWADKEFDRLHGSRLLATRANAQVVEATLLHDDGEEYALAAWCVMPTHVHVVIEQFRETKLSNVLHSWKSVSAHKINALEGRTGALWQREYFDRFMRSEVQFTWTVSYVENNPVAARLVERPDEWEFSSARWRRG